MYKPAQLSHSCPFYSCSPCSLARSLTGALIFVLFCAILNAGEPKNAIPVKPRKSNTSLRVQLHDLPGIQFLGLFVAQELGLFEREGLPPVTIQWKSGSRRIADILMEGDADLATGWMGEGMCGRSKGRKIVAISQVTQHSSCCVLVRQDALDSQHIRLEDLSNKKIGVWFRYEATPKAFIALNKIGAKLVVHRPDSNFLFAEKAVVAMFSSTHSVSFMTKYLEFRDRVLVFRFSDYNCDFPENAIFCTEKFLYEQPEVCRRFVRAMFKGWEETLQDEERALEIYSQYCRQAQVLDDPFIARQLLAAWKSILGLTPSLDANGRCDRKKYDRLLEGLIKAGEITPDHAPKFDDFFLPVLDTAVMERLKNGPPDTSSKSERGTK